MRLWLLNLVELLCHQFEGVLRWIDLFPRWPSMGKIRILIPNVPITFSKMGRWKSYQIWERIKCQRTEQLQVSPVAVCVLWAGNCFDIWSRACPIWLSTLYQNGYQKELVEYFAMINYNGYWKLIMFVKKKAILNVIILFNICWIWLPNSWSVATKDVLLQTVCWCQKNYVLCTL